MLAKISAELAFLIQFHTEPSGRVDFCGITWKAVQTRSELASDTEDRTGILPLQMRPLCRNISH